MGINAGFAPPGTTITINSPAGGLDNPWQGFPAEIIPAQV